MPVAHGLLTRQRSLADDCLPPAGDDDDASLLSGLRADLGANRKALAEVRRNIQEREGQQQTADADGASAELRELRQQERDYVAVMDKLLGPIDRLLARRDALQSAGEFLASAVRGTWLIWQLTIWFNKGCMFECMGERTAVEQLHVGKDRNSLKVAAGISGTTADEALCGCRDCAQFCQFSWSGALAAASRQRLACQHAPIGMSCSLFCWCACLVCPVCKFLLSAKLQLGLWIILRLR
jgi:hypothetical protein